MFSLLTFSVSSRLSFVKATFVGVGPSVEWLTAVGASSMYLSISLSLISVPV